MADATNRRIRVELYEEEMLVLEMPPPHSVFPPVLLTVSTSFPRESNFSMNLATMPMSPSHGVKGFCELSIPADIAYRFKPVLVLISIIEAGIATPTSARILPLNPVLAH